MRSGLRSIQFFPTFRCNEACGFCFNRGVAVNGKTSIHHFYQLVENMAVHGVAELDMLGGEPTLLPFLCERIEKCTAQNIRVNISTNGTNVPVLAKLSHQFSPHQVRIGISLTNKPLTDSLRTFIESTRPVLKSVCMRSQTIPDHALPYIDLPRVHYFLIFMDAVSPTDLRETISYPEFRCRLETLQRDYPNIQGVVCDGFVPNDQQFPELATARCPAGTTKLSVMPDGSTYPCYLLFRYPEFLLGNIFTDSIDALLTHPMLHFFRTFEGNSCKNKHCVYHADCHGGCPAVSLLLTRDITAPDPRCQVG